MVVNARERRPTMLTSYSQHACVQLRRLHSNMVALRCVLKHRAETGSGLVRATVIILSKECIIIRELIFWVSFHSCGRLRFKSSMNCYSKGGGKWVKNANRLSISIASLQKNQATGNFKQNMSQRHQGFFPNFQTKFSTIRSKHMFNTLSPVTAPLWRK